MKHVALKAIAFAMTLSTLPAHASEIEDFSGAPAQRWDFFSDRVMGGVSSGEADFTGNALRLTGTVSTANNGGFIQARLKLPDRLPEEATALVLRVRGNGDRYFVHLRTGGTLLPWHFYQAAFATGPEWALVRIPLDAFKPSTRMVRATPSAASVRSVAVAAFGHDHEADVSVDWIGWE
ncbi:CIA30 family protein [Maritimibacter sp. HL-12]|jgi:hypothetical protein|uniref:CIA30 family protein n=1 Tax=Maritimibacter sp. HL-12 TaxID=1162418 RepID=UPI000A0F0243|nr:CIA30 family protein [Maritimibacter sp. HL-12]SMH40396.1 Complex I intermediate-associated protein 30 (CIA30) [Maritimibacter sp. HL-12]